MNKTEPGKKGGMGEGVLRFFFYFSLPYSDNNKIIYNKIINYFPQVESLSPEMVIAEYLPMLLPQPISLLIYFLCPAQLRKGVIEQLWREPGTHPRPKVPQ